MSLSSLQSCSAQMSQSNPYTQGQPGTDPAQTGQPAGTDGECEIQDGGEAEPEECCECEEESGDSGQSMMQMMMQMMQMMMQMMQGGGMQGGGMQGGDCGNQSNNSSDPSSYAIQ